MGRRIFSFFLKVTDVFSDRSISSIPGIELFHRFIYKFIEPKGIILISVQGNKMYVNSQDKAIVRSLLTYGVWEEYETELFSRLLKPGDIVVDIGANIGYFTLIAAKLVGKEGRVYAFEPEPNNYELLVKNIEINGHANTIPIQKAVSNKPGKIKLFIDKVNLGAHSFSQDNILNQKGGFIEVETIRLDDFFENIVKDMKVDFIKMDAEGAEGLVVDGAGKVIENNNLKILMEFWPYGLKNMGINPLSLLHILQEYGLKIKLVDSENQCLKHTEIEKIIEMSENKPVGISEESLLLEK